MLKAEAKGPDSCCPSPPANSKERAKQRRGLPHMRRLLSHSCVPTKDQNKEYGRKVGWIAVTSHRSLFILKTPQQNLRKRLMSLNQI